MSLLQSLRIALRALAANRLRSALTMLGMIIGVGSVIALMAVGTGSTAQITSSIEGMGTNLLFVSPGAQQQGGVRQAAGTAATLTLEDAEAIADPSLAPSVAKVAPEVGAFGQIVAGSQNWNTRITGVTPEYADVRNYKLAEGEFITKQEMDTRALGHSAAVPDRGGSGERGGRRDRDPAGSGWCAGAVAPEPEWTAADDGGGTGCGVAGGRGVRRDRAFLRDLSCPEGFALEPYRGPALRVVEGRAAPRGRRARRWRRNRRRARAGGPGEPGSRWPRREPSDVLNIEVVSLV